MSSFWLPKVENKICIVFEKQECVSCELGCGCGHDNNVIWPELELPPFPSLTFKYVLCVDPVLHVVI